MTRTAGALIGRRRSSAFWGLGCPKTHHEIKDSLVPSLCNRDIVYILDRVDRLHFMGSRTAGV
ncbi:MAG: hypothetical protein ABW170_21790 [Candidatus Thiodiazotropha sp. L084R]